MREIYMDYNATTPPSRETLAKFKDTARSVYANASSLHGPGRQAKLILEEARQKTAVSLGAGAPEIIFTAGGSESDNIAIKGAAWIKGKGHIITSTIEHPAVINSCRFLEKTGFDVTYIRAGKSGQVAPEEVADAVRKDTFLITIMWANNETGVIQPVEEIAAIARQNKILFHSDAVQAFGKTPVDVHKVPVDLLSISGHKFYGPKGIGALYIRRGVRIAEFLSGGGQERGIRSGTQNVPAAAAMAEACESAARDLEDEGKRICALRDEMERRIIESVADAKINGRESPRLPNTSNITFKNAEGEAMLIGLDEHGIYASSASACAAGHTDPSHVLTAMGLSREEAVCTMRFSLGKSSRDDDIDRLVEVLPEIVSRLRALGV